MKKLLILITLIFANNAHTGFEPPVIIDPPNPQEGDMVRVGLFEKFYPPCLLIPQENSIGETYSLEINQDVITVNVLARTDVFCNPFPASPAPRVYYNLGNIPQGEYTVEVNYIALGVVLPPEDIPPFPLPPSFFSDSYGSPLNLIISGQPKVANSLSVVGLILMVFLFLLTQFVYRKN